MPLTRRSLLASADAFALSAAAQSIVSAAAVVQLRARCAYSIYSRFFIGKSSFGGSGGRRLFAMARRHPGREADAICARARRAKWSRSHQLSIVHFVKQ